MHNPLLDQPELLNRLHDQARQRAQQLRHEAIADFWRGADALLDDAATRARRAAERLAYRLQRRFRSPARG